MNDRDNLIKEFLTESHENLDRLDRDLLDLEDDPHNVDRLGSVFRTIHTIKGSCGFLSFSKLEAVSHAGEGLLSRLRDSELTLDVEIASALLRMVDAIRRMLRSIEATGSEGDADQADLAALLTRLGQGQAASAVAASQAVTQPGPAARPPLSVDAPSSTAPVTADALHAGANRSEDDDRRTGEDRRHEMSESSLRVDVALLDRLMNLVGELVLARNQILQFTDAQANSAFSGATGRLNLVTSELQEGVMKTRMQPIGNVWSKFPRIVRDLATTCGKRVRIEMEGRETDLDKAIIEAIKDPLTHVVRNSVDHGIERPDERAARGKPVEGRIRLRAFHEGGQITIEISDDGAGISAAKVRDKALQRGLVSADQARSMSDQDLVRLIFLPGLSTAEQITNVSGRGVGMDVVKTNIERIGGQVDIQSVPGEGTTLRITIPLTLAIIPVLMVATGGDRYAIPQVSLLELLRLEAGSGRTQIDRIDGMPFYRLRGRLLPLIDLQQQLGVAARNAEAANIVVLRVADRQFGLVVEEVHDTEEIVVKPLGKQLQGLRMFAGATILGDGHVALILDVLGIAQRAHVVGDARDGGERIASNAAGDQTADARPLLLFRSGEGERMAIPLDAVARLEEFQPTAIERSGGQEVVQYRNVVMPLVNVAEFFGVARQTPDSARQVIVVRDAGRQIGLVVDQVLDIVNEPVAIQRPFGRTGIMGSVVLQGKVTDLVDAQALIRDHESSFGGSVEAA